jgi:glycine hydroxymethyltransferase
VGRIIAAALAGDFEAGKADLTERVAAIADRYPLYEHLAAQATAV